MVFWWCVLFVKIAIHTHKTVYLVFHIGWLGLKHMCFTPYFAIMVEWLKLGALLGGCCWEGWVTEAHQVSGLLTATDPRGWNVASEPTLIPIHNLSPSPSAEERFSLRCTSWITSVVWIPSSWVLQHCSVHSNYNALCRKKKWHLNHTNIVTNLCIISNCQSRKHSKITFIQYQCPWIKVAKHEMQDSRWEMRSVYPPYWLNITLRVSQSKSVCGSVPHGLCFQVFGAVISEQMQGS